MTANEKYYLVGDGFINTLDRYPEEELGEGEYVVVATSYKMAELTVEGYNHGLYGLGNYYDPILQRSVAVVMGRDDETGGPL